MDSKKAIIICFMSHSMYQRDGLGPSQTRSDWKRWNCGCAEGHSRLAVKMNLQKV